MKMPQKTQSHKIFGKVLVYPKTESINLDPKIIGGAQEKMVHVDQILKCFTTWMEVPVIYQKKNL